VAGRELALLDLDQDARIPRFEDREAPEELARHLQAYNPAAMNNKPCQDLDVVDACRGMSVGRKYIGNFAPYEGSCEGEFYGDFPIYFCAEKKLYLYALDVYPDDWSSEALRGLVRWRIASFSAFEDKTTCRYEQANRYQIDFAADGQPYNYNPNLFCFDDNGSEFAGYQASTITIICNDIVVQASDSGGDDGGGANTGLIVGLIAVILLLVGGYLWTRRQRQREPHNFPSTKAEDEETEKQREAAEKLDALEEAKPTVLEVNEKRDGKKVVSSPATTSGHTNGTEEADTSDEEPGKKSLAHLRSLNKKQMRKANDSSKPSSAQNEESSAVPDEIRSMVANLDSYFNSNVDDNNGSRGKASGLSRSQHTPTDNDRSNNNQNGRSRSVDRRNENDKQGRSRSLGRPQDQTDQSNGKKALSVSRRDEPGTQSTSVPRQGDADQPTSTLGRSRPVDRRQDKGYPSRSTSIGKPDHSSAHTSSQEPTPQPRSRSISRKDEGKDENRRARSVTPAGRAALPQSQSLSRSLHKDYEPRPRGKSLDPQDRDNAKFRSIAPLGTVSKAKPGRLDASSTERSVEKQPDGSVLVIQKRLREDGATVTTRTKYANVALAKKHGVDIN
jgi:hypothetical protein